MPNSIISLLHKKGGFASVRTHKAATVPTHACGGMVRIGGNVSWESSVVKIRGSRSGVLIIQFCL